MTPKAPAKSASTPIVPFRALFRVEGRGPVARLDIAPWMVTAAAHELLFLREQGGVAGDPALRLAIFLGQLGNPYAEELHASLGAQETLSLVFEATAFDAWAPHHRPHLLVARRLQEACEAFQGGEHSLHTVISPLAPPPARDVRLWDVVTDAAPWFRSAEAGVIASWAPDGFCGGEVSEIFLRAMAKRGDLATCTLVEVLGGVGGDGAFPVFATLSEEQVMDWLRLHRPDAYQASIEALLEAWGQIPIPGHEAEAAAEEPSLA